MAKSKNKATKPTQNINTKHEKLTKKQIFSRIFRNTRKNILRNKWLSLATIIVVTITFTIATLFLALTVISSRTISVFEQKAPIIIYFENDTEEKLIQDVKKQIEDTGLVSEVDYLDKEQALERYKSYYDEYPTLVESSTTEDVLPTLLVKPKSIENMPELSDICNDIKSNTSEINDIWYFKDVVDTLRGISKVIKIGGAILVVSLSLMSIVLILIAIGFNINSHRKEIEVMNLIGSTDFYIKIPFLLEGMFYGISGSLIAVITILVLWYGSIFLMRDNNLFVLVSGLFTDIQMTYLKEFNIIFLLTLILSEILAGSLIGFLSSQLAIRKYLK
ncbi:hypothetical protein JW887_01475 [Candidatus Dojkabacteria bacterium]|nr:hypothetical protein [Candidatus Dojkabacteria bacterium]